MSFSTVFTVVTDLYVVDGIGDEVIQFFIIEIGADLEVTITGLEGIVAAQNEVDGALRFDIFVQFDDIVACCVLYGGS